MRRGTLIREAGRIVAFEARNPQGDRRARDVQKLTDTALTPALRIQGDDLLTSLRAVGMAMVGEERPAGRGCWLEAFPEALHRLAREAMHRGMKNDAGEFTEPEPRVEAFEPPKFVHDGVGHPQLALGRVDRQSVGHEPEHPLLRKAALEAAHRFRMGPGFLRPLRRGPLGPEQQRADEFIPLLRGVDARQEGVIRLRIRSRQGSLPVTPRPGGCRSRRHAGQPEPRRRQGHSAAGSVAQVVVHSLEREGGYCSAVTASRRVPVGQGPRSCTPAEAAIALAVDMVAVVGDMVIDG
jgi:hypothetical protein